MRRKIYVEPSSPHFLATPLSIIITGQPESQTSDDRTEFLRMCEENLTIEPTIATNGCIRIGKQLPNVPRRILARLNSEETAATVLKDAPKLRSSVDRHVARNVYINPDLAPAAAKLVFEARKKRRELKWRQQNNETTSTMNSISQSANAPSNENNTLVVETTDVPPPINDNFGTNCHYRNDQSHLLAGACALIADISANKNSLGPDLDPSRIAEANDRRANVLGANVFYVTGKRLGGKRLLRYGQTSRVATDQGAIILLPFTLTNTLYSTSTRGHAYKLYRVITALTRANTFFLKELLHRGTIYRPQPIISALSRRLRDFKILLT